VAVGVFLGGGSDSSAITAFASSHVGTGKLKTFSIGFAEQSFDETEFARRVCAIFKTDHNEEMLSANRAREIADDCLSRLDEPLGDSSILPTYLLSGFARQAVKVALGGDGGDEMFAGYDPFLALRRAKLYRAIFPRPVHQGIKALFNRLPVSHANMAPDFKIKRALRGLDYDARFWLPVWMAPVEFDVLQELFSQPLDIEDIYSEAIELWDSCPQDDLVDKTLQFYTKLYLQNDILTKIDRVSMMHSLEVRAPFLDIELVDFARRIPSNYKFRRGTTKYILKKSLESVLPREIVYRAKKGFGVPIGAWFKNSSFPIHSARFGDLNPRLIERKLADHRAGKSDERALLWCFYVLSKWWKASQTSS